MWCYIIDLKKTLKRMVKLRANAQQSTAAG
jgi:hypothetical protein